MASTQENWALFRITRSALRTLLHRTWLCAWFRSILLATMMARCPNACNVRNVHINWVRRKFFFRSGSVTACASKPLVECYRLPICLCVLYMRSHKIQKKTKKKSIASSFGANFYELFAHSVLWIEHRRTSQRKRNSFHRSQSFNYPLEEIRLKCMPIYHSSSDILKSIQSRWAWNIYKSKRNITFIAAPAASNLSLGIKLQFLTLILKNMHKCFSFEIPIRDDENQLQRYQASNFKSCTRSSTFCVQIQDTSEFVRFRHRFIIWKRFMFASMPTYDCMPNIKNRKSIDL